MCKRIVFFKAINGGAIIPKSAVSTALPLADNAFQRLSGKRDSNPRPSAWEADALPTELLPQKYNTNLQKF